MNVEKLREQLKLKFSEFLTPKSYIHVYFATSQVNDNVITPLLFDVFRKDEDLDDPHAGTCQADENDGIQLPYYLIPKLTSEKIHVLSLNPRNHACYLFPSQNKIAQRALALI